MKTTAIGVFTSRGPRSRKRRSTVLSSKARKSSVRPASAESVATSSPSRAERSSHRPAVDLAIGYFAAGALSFQ
jgi:hypothetical protein